MKLLKKHSRHSKSCNFAWRQSLVDSDSTLAVTKFSTVLLAEDPERYARAEIGQHSILISRAEARELVKRFTEELEKEDARR